MPCYTAWNEYLEVGTPAYERAEAELRAKLRALRHAIDYYYGAAGASVPHAHRPGEGRGGNVTEGLVALAPPAGESGVLDRITHHLACDGVSVSLLYDAATLVPHEEPSEAGYARVLLLSAHRMLTALSDASKPTSAGAQFSLDLGVWYAAEFLGDEFAGRRHYSPIRVDGLELLKTGRGELRLAFWHQNYPEGVQDKVYKLRVLERAATYILVRSLEHDPARILHITTLTWRWLGDKLGIYRRERDDDDVQKRFGWGDGASRE